ncbi:hypothetical protein PGT21_033368 [Puccinia graminis f. sp. tritici]|uniref:F-box domain-containing protein n=1 Tax=Puccinia graminis f. sp. tritici TaxID=56615 RepID=A0A5B0M6I6_PUCGR|nr:hypothetical protein PGT21_033368 [Puccinia graminis f. sp. tritici]KAA1086397.1 hypothetical protein PGTUg99_022670 [Puccinia graminis f. sp. tritici]
MAIPRNHPASGQAPKPMPVLPHEIIVMIFQSLETLVSLEESIDTARPEWHVSGSVQRSFQVNQVRLLEILNRHWTLISLVSQFWHKAVSDRRQNFPTTIKSSSTQLPLIRLAHPILKITNISAQINGDQVFSTICSLNACHPLESITLYQDGQELEPSEQSWDSLSQVKYLRELIIHQPLSIPFSSVFKLLESCLNLQVLKIYSFGDLASPQSSIPPIGNHQEVDEDKMRKTLKHLTCHFSLPWHPSQSCNSLVSLLRKGISSLNILTLVFDNRHSDLNEEDNLEDEEEQVAGIQAFRAEGLLEVFRNCRNLQTLRLAAPAEISNLPLVDPIINNLQALEHLHLKGNVFSPLLFTMNALPKTLKTIDCQAYSSPILPLLRALRNSLRHLTNLESLTITTYRRKPRNFAEALYGQLDLPLPTEEVTRDEPLSWDLDPTETLVEQNLLTQECQLRSIKIDGPRAYAPPSHQN